MLKALSIQVQPELAPDLNVADLKRILETLVATSPLVTQQQFDEGFDKGPYFNFTFGTDDLKGLWALIQLTVFADDALAQSMAKASIVVCEGSDGWNDYLQLFHFDPTVPRDSVDAT